MKTSRETIVPKLSQFATWSFHLLLTNGHSIQFVIFIALLQLEWVRSIGIPGKVLFEMVFEKTSQTFWSQSSSYANECHECSNRKICLVCRIPFENVYASCVGKIRSNMYLMYEWEWWRICNEKNKTWWTKMRKNVEVVGTELQCGIWT